jgi:hypothetical protein
MEQQQKPLSKSEWEQEMQSRAERLKRQGKMPPLDQVKKDVAEAVRKAKNQPPYPEESVQKPPHQTSGQKAGYSLGELAMPEDIFCNDPERQRSPRP